MEFDATYRLDVVQHPSNFIRGNRCTYESQQTNRRNRPKQYSNSLTANQRIIYRNNMLMGSAHSIYRPHNEVSALRWNSFYIIILFFSHSKRVHNYCCDYLIITWRKVRFFFFLFPLSQRKSYVLFTISATSLD